MTDLEQAELRLQKVIRFAEQNCGACKDCDEACASDIVRRIARGEPVHECALCAERFDDSLDRDAHEGGGMAVAGLCWYCWGESDEKTRAWARDLAKERMADNVEPLPFQTLEARVKELEAELDLAMQMVPSGAGR